MIQSEFPEKHTTFLQYRDADEVEGEVVQKPQLDNMARRFEKLSTRLNELHRRLTFEEVKSRLLVNLAEIDRYVETWRSKYCSEDNITRLLADYQVCTLLYTCCFVHSVILCCILLLHIALS